MAWKICSFNKNLLPLKVTLFCFSSGLYALIPYLTIHMKDIGISDIDIALIYTILPFCVFMAPPLVGFFADRLGSYTRVLQLNVFLCGLFHTLLLAVPKNYNSIVYPTATANIAGSEMTLAFEKCNSTLQFPTLQNLSSTDLLLMNCSYSCLTNLSNVHKMDACAALAPKCTKVKNGDFVLRSLLPNPEAAGDGGVTIKMEFRPDPCFSDRLNQVLSLPERCSLECGVQTDLISYCDYVEGEGRLTTNIFYFLFRMLATAAMVNCWVMLDAQTLQMCELEKEDGRSGAYGRQIAYMTISQAIISPLVGLLMDKVKQMTGSTNYVTAFLLHDLALVTVCISVNMLKKDIGLPKNQDTTKGIKLIFRNISCLIFLLMMFVCGSMWGFIETFLFVFLKEDLGAPIYLLGLTITTGALVSIPFLFYADAIIDRFGQINIIILSLIMYGVRYVGYSFITCAWYAFPFEALEVFTFNLLRVASSKYVREQAPPGTLASLTGLSTGAHFGFGKGVGALVGGVLRDQTNTSTAFRIFGILAFAFGLLYATFHAVSGRKIDARTRDAKQRQVAEDEKMVPFIQNKRSIVKPDIK